MTQGRRGLRYAVPALIYAVENNLRFSVIKARAPHRASALPSAVAAPITATAPVRARSGWRAR